VVARESSQPHVEALESSQPHVEAWESSQPHVVARGSSQPHVVARGSSQPHVVARGSSQPHVVARGSSQPHVVARGYVQLSVAGAVTVQATENVRLISDGRATINGGQSIIIDRSSPEKWCQYYGPAPDQDGIVVLYKAVDDNFRSPHQQSYAPGTVPRATDWDGGREECGGGLHFSPYPLAALAFFAEATRFVACPVYLTDIVVHPNGQYPEKVKAPRCAAPVWEVDRYGNRLS
jgi:hypothetical protein